MRRRIEQALARHRIRFQAEARVIGDGNLSGTGNHFWDETKPRRHASVLVPIVEHAAGFTLILTQRTDHLPDHPGQVSFPGGRAEAHDADEIATALREAEEEIGLEPGLVDVAGRLDTYLTGTGFEVTPIVGFIKPGFTLDHCEHEVAEVFEVPLAFLLDPANHKLESGFWRGATRHYYAMPYEGHHIWGATAGMIANFYEIVTGETAIRPPDPVFETPGPDEPAPEKKVPA